MKLETELLIFDGWDDKDKQRQAEHLLGTIRSFANMSNYAFWDEETEGSKDCIIVYGFIGCLRSGICIKKKDIEKTVESWCKELAVWCNDDVDEGSAEFTHKRLRIEISDLQDDGGGLSIECFDKDDNIDHELHILPIKEVVS